MAGKQTTQEWFDEECDKRRPLWDARIEDLVEEGDPRDQHQRYLRYTARFAQNARDDLLRLEAELGQMVVRTAAILTAATLLFAAYALKPNLKALATYLSLALCFAAVGFVASLVPLRPPFVRAWFKPYVSRFEWTLLVHDDFTSWVMDCWLGERRQDVLTTYKKAHAVAVPVLIVAAVVLAVGIMTNLH